MGALFLKDLADKTRRGLEGRVRRGRSGGGLCYGYRVVRGGPAGPDGAPERGLRDVDPAQAAVVRRIFAGFVAGHGPKAIAAALNREGVPGPRGGIWSAGAIRGHARQGTGILRNRLYAGQLVWNQRRWVKDPATGRRRGRPNDPAAVLVHEVPELRIVDEALWCQAQERLAAQRAAVERDEASGRTRRRFWEQRRPAHLLSDKIVCGGCGTPFAAVGRDYLACRVALAGGPCANRARVRRDRVEAEVLDALGARLMRPELVAEFVLEFTAEWDRLRAEAGGGLAPKRRELEAVRRKLAGLVEAIADGLRAPGLQGRLDELETRRAALEAEVAAAVVTPALPRLHPNLAEVYRERAARLRTGLAAGVGDGGPEVLEAARALVDRGGGAPAGGSRRSSAAGVRGRTLGHAASGGRGCVRNQKRPEAGRLRA